MHVCEKAAFVQFLLHPLATLQVLYRAVSICPVTHAYFWSCRSVILCSKLCSCKRIALKSDLNFLIAVLHVCQY